MSLKVIGQYLAPHRALSRLVHWATRWRWRPWKNWLIRTIITRYDVDMTSAVQPDPLAYPHFNAFFTRALKPEARPLPEPADAIVCPADGRISQMGAIDAGSLLQAKGKTYTVDELVADPTLAKAFDHGHFVTVYLSPRDYHRVHMPAAGTLISTTHIPGRLFSVAPFAVDAIPRLFARNERLVCHFRGPIGEFCVILVGAMLVSSIDTVWDGQVIPPYGRGIRTRHYAHTDITLAAGAEMGRFNMGSTVILLLPPTASLTSLANHKAVNMGQYLGCFAREGE